MMDYYLYRHIRLDTNQPFYIGIGKQATYSKPYARSRSLSQRNAHWKNVFNFCGKNIDIEIVYESNSWDEITKKEQEFIKLYGRNDLGLGPLVNMTDGGEGRINWKITEETRNRMSLGRLKVKMPKISEIHKQRIREAKLGRKPSEETRKKISESSKNRKTKYITSEETKKKISIAGKGKKRSKEVREKLSAIRKLMNINLSQERRDEISKLHRGKKLSDETRLKMSIAKRLYWAKKKGGFSE